MGPPPPSKSYLWKFDDDDDSSTASSSSDSSPSREAVEYYSSSDQEVCRHELNRSFNNLTDENFQKNSSEESSTIFKEQPQQQSQQSQRKNKRKKKKKKKKSKHTSSTATTTDKPLRQDKHVAFDKVVIREFRRCLGEGVPSDGGWPLGLDMEASFSHAMTLDDYETAKQEKLRNRWLEWYYPDSDQVPETLETRPFDYKSGVKNQLFRSLTEHSRMKLLLASGDHDVHHSSSSSPPLSHAHKRRTRSKSVTDEYSDDFPHVEVLHVRNELEKLRASRSLEGHTGCTCRKLHVYLLPPGGGGKKAHSRRLSAPKVKEELRKRHRLPSEHKTREELELLLHSIVAEEPCCAQDCPCAQNGINCQVDACSCWLASHTDDKKASNRVPNQEIKERCGNKYGMYAIDASKVDADRKEQIRMYCQEVGKQLLNGVYLGQDRAVNM